MNTAPWNSHHMAPALPFRLIQTNFGDVIGTHRPAMGLQSATSTGNAGHHGFNPDGGNGPVFAQRAFARSRNGGSWLGPDPPTTSSKPDMNPVFR